MKITKVAETVIREMIEAYPGDFILDEKEPIVQIIADAQNYEFGDTLFSFAILELADVIGGMNDLDEARIEAKRALQKAVADLQVAMEGIPV